MAVKVRARHEHIGNMSTGSLGVMTSESLNTFNWVFTHKLLDVAFQISNKYSNTFRKIAF